jgi:hypothetical protein
VKSLFHLVRPIVGATFVVVLASCATPPAPKVSGRWTPVNHYGDQPQAIPLRPAYVYYAAPVDRTLKGLLERWARDSRMTLDYGHDADFTLYRPVADVHSDDLHAAVASLGALYASQQVAIAVEGGRIVVRRAAAAPAPAGTTR